MRVTDKARRWLMLSATLLLVSSTFVASSALAALSTPPHQHDGMAMPPTYYDATVNQAAASSPQDVNVALGNNFFNPQFITVSLGTTVVWTNPVSRNHTVTSDPTSLEVFDSGNMAQNAVFTFTFTLTGTFGYHCTYHGTPGTGMYGTVTVVDGGPTPTATPTSPPQPTSTPTNTMMPSNTPTHTATPMPSSTPTHTNTPPPASTATNTPPPASTATNTPPPPTNTPPATGTPMPTNTPPAATATTALTTTPTDCPNSFVDVSGNVFYGAIHYLACRGDVNGTDATHYSPGGTSTRGQFAKVVVLGFGTPLYTPAFYPDFSDVPTTYYAYVYIESGFHAGVLSGFDAATCQAAGQPYPCYLPNRAITRGQLTKLVVNAAHYTAYTPAAGPDFSDVPANNVFYVSIETAYHMNVISGYADHTFRPNNNIRRDEMAQIVFKGVTTP